MCRCAALLDRDGTIIENRHYLSDPRDVRLLPSVGQGLRDLVDLGLMLVIITNQSGIGRGLFSSEQARLVHEEMVRQLACEQVQLSGVYTCPHAPTAGCSCRKPALGLIEQAARELNFRPEDSFMFGDSACDIELGRRVGAKTFLVRSDYDHNVESQTGLGSDFIVEGVAQAVPIVLSLLDRPEKEVGIDSADM